MAAAESRAAIPLRPALTVTEEELLVLTHGDLGVVLSLFMLSVVASGRSVDLR
ncbi:hypothetical protein [Ornithinimicrobium cryptoxanthini]|uniref:hypothetical protein n=1 Tax=Ornithinimicrobium cryptoxanthini TaxID=2934161 RepID=UPI002117A691|nr:hypothetical protein [Ornithinimicrobium cryptoxanthini]